MIRSCIILLISFNLFPLFAQIKVADVGDGWKNKVDSAILIIKKYDQEKTYLVII